MANIYPQPLYEVLSLEDELQYARGLLTSLPNDNVYSEANLTIKYDDGIQWGSGLYDLPMFDGPNPGLVLTFIIKSNLLKYRSLFY